MLPVGYPGTELSGQGLSTPHLLHALSSLPFLSFTAVATGAGGPAPQGLAAAISLFGVYCKCCFTAIAHTAVDTEGKTGGYTQMYFLLCPRFAPW